MLTARGERVTGAKAAPVKPVTRPDPTPSASPAPSTNLTAYAALLKTRGFAKFPEYLPADGLAPITRRAVLAGELVTPKPKTAATAPEAPKPPKAKATQQNPKKPEKKKPSRIAGYAIASASVIAAIGLAAFGAKTLNGGSQNGQATTGNAAAPSGGAGFNPVPTGSPYTEYVGGGVGTIPGAIY